MERLQRILASHGIASRRASETLIVEGRVKVNGKVVRELGTKADPTKDRIEVDGRPLSVQSLRYLMLNKPSGYITTVSDERNRRTVMELIDIRERVYPVGRLDRETEGLLLLTNDGALANRIIHPRYELDKEYEILTLVRPSPATMGAVSRGVQVDGTLVVPTEFRILRETAEGILLRLVIHSGLNRVVRKMMDRHDIQIERLRRTRIGPISLGRTPVGYWRELRPAEVADLFSAVGLEGPELNGVQ
ncbi:MAG: rRNA pseudouridine synthase [Thermomicrobiales bacterium]|nr:rRNA pseudouridine synthase [Thermomicrobiales bacterium]MCO5220393.1 rRNA pseudouridine synthase [Thermomicrobiales bacterium]